MTRIGKFLPLLLLSVCCKSPTPPEPEGTQSETEPVVAPEKTSAPAALSTQALGASAPSGAPSSPPAVRAAVPPGHRQVNARPIATVPVSKDDPLAGKFSLEQSLQGLTGQGALVAEIKTNLGKLNCELYEAKAPTTVANFVGLARGLRPFKNPKGAWVKAPAYDGTTFHRVVRGFMIQGGDPEGTGAGEPGYVIADEIWDDAYHSARGLLCMANRGPNTNGMQFFIMDGSAPHLDNGYTIFGKCGPDAVITKLAEVEVRGDRAVEPPKIEKVTVRREASATKATGTVKRFQGTAGARP